jgi:hypothetical protein
MDPSCKRAADRLDRFAAILESMRCSLSPGAARGRNPTADTRF